MARETSALYEPMTGSLNIHPPTHPHLLSVIQPSLTHRQTQPEGAYTDTHTHTSLLCDQLLAPRSQPIIRNRKREKKKRQTGRDQKIDRKDMEKTFLCDTKLKLLLFQLVMRNVILLLRQLHVPSVLTKQIQQLHSDHYRQISHVSVDDLL